MPVSCWSSLTVLYSPVLGAMAAGQTSAKSSAFPNTKAGRLTRLFVLNPTRMPCGSRISKKPRRSAMLGSRRASRCSLRSSPFSPSERVELTLKTQIRINSGEEMKKNKKLDWNQQSGESFGFFWVHHRSEMGNCEAQPSRYFRSLV